MRYLRSVPTPRTQPHRHFCIPSTSSTNNDDHLNPIDSFRFFISSTPQTPSSTTTIINLLTTHSLFDLYWTVLEDFRATNSTLNSTAFSTLISAYSRLNQPHKAVETFVKMYEFRCKPDLETYNMVLRILLENHISILAVLVLRMMDKLDCKPQVSTFNILIEGLCKSEKLGDAVKVFDQMRERGIVPDTMTYTVLFKGLCREKRVDDAYALFRMMRMNGCRPDSVICDVLVNGFCKAGRLDEAFALTKSFRGEGEGMGLCGYSSLIDGLVDADRTDEALRFFLKVFEVGITPDVVVYSIMIRGLCNSGRLEDAINLMGDMAGRGLVPDTSCYNALINGFCDMGLLEEGRSLQLEIVETDCLPNTKTCTILICGMCKNGMVGEEAQQLFNEMDKVGCSESATDGLCKAGHIEEADLMFYKMEIGKSPSVFLRLSQDADKVIKSVRQKVEKLYESGSLLKAHKLLTQSADSGVVPDMHTYNTLIHGFCKARKFDAVLKLYEELHLNGHSPNLVTFTTLVDGLERAVKKGDAINLYEQLSNTKCGHFPEAHLVVMKWCCRSRKTLSAFSKWLKYQKSLVGGQDDVTLKSVEKLIEKGDMATAVRMLLERDIQLKNMDPRPYNFILTGFCWARRTKEAMELFSILEEFSTEISPPTCVLLISYLLRDEELDRAVHVFLYTLEKGLHLMPRVCNNLISSLLGCQERVKDAFHLLKKMKSLGYDLKACLQDGTRFRLYRIWSTKQVENDTPGWDDPSGFISDAIVANW